MDAWTLYAWQRVEENLSRDIRELRNLVERLEDVRDSLHNDKQGR